MLCHVRQHLLGISSLHQLRGRVGRSSVQGYAYLMHPDQIDTKAEQRLRKVQTESALGSGFSLSQHDLEARGAGNLFGEAQKGSRSRATGAECRSKSASMKGRTRHDGIPDARKYEPAGR